MGRSLGLDFGLRRLGFAVSDPTGFLATPLSVFSYTRVAEATGEVLRLCRETGAERLVIGLPLNMDGSSGPLAEAVEAFREKLQPLLDVPIELWDERLTTRGAERVLIEAGTRRRRRKEVVDKLAAQIMLQSYLDAKAPGDNDAY